MTSDAVQHSRRWKTLAVLSLSLVIIGLDNTILNVALPTMQAEFDASSSKLQWMVDSYLLVFAGLLLVFGTLGDRLAASSLSRPASRSSPRQPGRARRRLGRPGDRRPRVDGRRRGADHAGHAVDHRECLQRRGARQGDRHLGPRCGRDRARAADRRAPPRVVRLVVRLPRQRPVAAAALLLGMRYVPESRDPKPGSFDLLGAALSTAGFSILVYAIIEAPEQGLDVRPRAGAPGRERGAARLVSLVEHRTAEPMLDLGFFRNARFSVGTAAVSVAFFALLGGIFALTQYLQFAHGYSAIGRGVDEPGWRSG